jgi:hypothetical protein
MLITNPFVSMVFVSIVTGLWLFGEQFTGGAPRIAAAVVSFVAMIVGVVMLAPTAPSFAAAERSEH